MRDGGDSSGYIEITSKMRAARTPLCVHSCSARFEIASLCFANSDKDCSRVFLSTNPIIRSDSLGLIERSPITIKVVWIWT